MGQKKTTALAGFALLALTGFCSQILLASGPPLPESLAADKVLVLKSERKLFLMKGDEVLKTYIVALGRNPVGSKVRQGDSRTPEGTYVLDRHNPNSQYHRSIHISYPNADDAARARRMGVSPGGDVFLHGLPNGFHGLLAPGDWTEGCIAVTNTEIDEIWRAVADGTPIEIKP
jgi:murein L,D-transpeptidase YafK